MPPATPGRSRASGVAAAAALILSLIAAPEAAAADDWEPAEPVPQQSGAAEDLRSVALPDGTLVALWTFDDPGPNEAAAALYRSVRPAGGAWGAPEAFGLPVQSLVSVAVAPAGALQISYLDGRSEPAARVRLWNVDGSLGVAGPVGSDSITLADDAQGDVVATSLGTYYQGEGRFNRDIDYFDGRTWRSLPALRADPRDVYVPGRHDDVLMAGYDTDHLLLRVKRWTADAGWQTEWKRNYRGRPTYKPRVIGLDLDADSTNRVALAFNERETRRRGPRMMMALRRGSIGWSTAHRLQGAPRDERVLLTGPRVSLAPRYADVAWTSSTGAPGRRAVRLANWDLEMREPKTRVLETVRSTSGFRDLALDVDVGYDSSALVTYLDPAAGLVGWLGAPGSMTRTALLPTAVRPRGDSAHIPHDGEPVRPTAAVIWPTTEGAFSRVAETSAAG